MDPRELTARVKEYLSHPPREDLHDAVAISQEKMQTLADFWPLVGFVFDGPGDDPKAREKWLGDEGRAALAAARAALGDVDPWTAETLEPALGGVLEAEGLKPGKLYQPIRVAVSGTTVSPGIFETLAVLGRDESLARMDRVLQGDS
jgi:glutamyl-tRNA synthetase